MTAVAQSVRSLIEVNSIDVNALAGELDALEPLQRVQAVRAMSGKMQRRLWAAVEGRVVTVADIVPEEVPPSVEIIHAGKNSLPLFTQFEKRFCRTEDDANVLYGYNDGPTKNWIGPGYFVARMDEDRGELGVNYLKVPPRSAKLPGHWPAIKPNEQGLQRFVYAKMIDYLRMVSKHVVIGRAVREGKETQNYFVLCRLDV